MAQVDRGDQTHRKMDTVMLIDYVSAPTTDASNLLTNPSTFFNTLYELNSARTALAGPRELTCQFAADNTNAGYLFNHGNTAGTSFGYRMRINGSGNIICEDDAGEIFNVALPDVDGTTRTFTAQWCTTANYLTTGASDAYRSTLWLYCDTGTYAIHRASHAVNPVDATEEFSMGGLYTGAAASNEYDGSLYWFRVGKRFHSTVEAAGDWVASYAAPSNAGQSYVQQPPMPTRIGQDGEFAGPQLLYANMAHDRNAMRLLSPIVNEAFLSPLVMTDDITDDVASGGLGMILTQDTNFQAHIGLLRKRPVPETFNKIYVRVSGQLYDTGAGTPDQEEVRIYVANHRPGQQVANSQIQKLTLTWTADDTSAGPPTWKTGTMKIPSHDGWLYIWPAFRCNGGVASANTRFKFWAWSLDPIVDPVSNDQDFPPVQLPP